MRKTSAALLIIMGFAVVVNAAKHKSLQDLIREAEASGESTTPREDDVNLGGVPAGAPGKALEVDEKDATDSVTHDFVVYEKDGKPVAVIFCVISEGKRQTEYLNLVCDSTGKMNQCYRQTGDRDESGKPIRGSAKTSALGRKDKRMSALLRHELDFWLKGMYRKPAAKPAN